jgi:hypothetical protein
MISRRIAHLIPNLLFLVPLSRPILAQEFSADMVHTKPAGALPSKVFVKGDKIRFETRNGEHHSILILDVVQQTGFMVMPESKVYASYKPGRSAPGMPFFHPAGSEDACSAWEKYVNKPGSCAKVGEEKVGDRAAVKYKGIARSGDPGFLWIDRKLNFVIKWEGQAGAAELQNIRETSQAAGLFQIPKDYEQMEVKAQKQTPAKQAPPKAKPAAKNPQNQ